MAILSVIRRWHLRDKVSLREIVSQIKNGPVTRLRSDADIVVTEWGAPELRGKSLTARIKAMIAISHPDFRETLEREVRSAH